MNLKQHTIKKNASVTGVGLHTGQNTTLEFLPADIDHGIQFQRVDLEDQPIISALAENVVDTSRGTTIANGEATISTIEHALSALVGLEIDNVLIKIDGPEVPILDGSSLQFLEALEEVGVEEQDAERKYYEVSSPVSYKDEASGVEVTILPYDGYRVTTMIDFESKVIGQQFASINSLKEYKEQIAPCRTFCFLHELEFMYNNNLIKGGDLSNAIVFVDRVLEEEDQVRIAKLLNKEKVEIKEAGVLDNITLRFDNEPARHKLLDVLGDLALAGRPIKGHVIATKPGHKANTELAKTILKAIKKEETGFPDYDPKLPAVADVNDITAMLPHRYPFQLVDKIFYLDSTKVAGIKNVTINEPFFQGHFPNNPVMPGVLQVEVMAQTGGILAMNTVDNPEDYWTYFLSIEKCRFKRMVVPGDTLIIHCELLAPIKRGIAKMRGRAYVGGKLACEVILAAALVKKS